MIRSSAIERLEPDDRRKVSEQARLPVSRSVPHCIHSTFSLPLQILASARLGAEVSKQFAALEHAVPGYMAQLEGKSGVGDHAAVLAGLQSAMNSSQSQVGNLLCNHLW